MPHNGRQQNYDYGLSGDRVNMWQEKRPEKAGTTPKTLTVPSLPEGKPSDAWHGVDAITKASAFSRRARHTCLP